MDKKERHQQFVTGFAGGPVQETYAVSAVIVLSVVVQYYVSQVLPDSASKYLCDFIFNWLVVLASVTFYANHLYLLAGILLATLILATIAKPRGPTSKSKSTEQKEKKNEKEKKQTKQAKEPKEAKGPLVTYRPFLTNYRSAMMVLTMTSILAVDFTAFPRRFAKTETWGTSLMDLGVGSFVFSLGIVSSRKELKSGNSMLPFLSELRISINHTLKVFALGIIRLVSVKALDYQEHESEYGVHWNFFFTLSLLPIAFTLVRRLNFPVRLSYTIKGLLIALSHEIVLKNTGLMEWTLTSPRVNLLSQNKEGLVSFVGYLAIFTFGYSLGLHILNAKTQFKEIITQCAIWAVLAQIAMYVLRIATEPSRRLANLPYVAWVVAFNAGFVAILAIIEKVTDSKPSESYVAVNKFGETMFVLSNVGTGLVNMAVDTVSLDRYGTMTVLTAYLATLMASAFIQVKYRS